MLPLNLPPLEANIKQVDGNRLIYDSLRRRFVALTPEEWVRQHFVNFLIAYKGYPKSFLQNEVALRIGEVSRRADTVVYRSDLTPRMIIEYKAPSVKITQKAFRQVLNYDRVLRADYLTLSNGLTHYCLSLKGSAPEFLSDIPCYADL